MTLNASLSGAQCVARALVQHGVRTIFTLSGNQILPLYDALLSEGVRLIATRHEAAAVHMADAAAQLTGRVGVVVVTAGPGHTNTLTGLAVAQGNESPVLLLSGAPAVSTRGSGAFQEMPQAAVAAPVTKWAASADVVARVGVMVERALALAEAEVPGPVSLTVPYDVQLERADEQAEDPVVEAPTTVADSLDALARALQASQAPLLLGSPWVARTGAFLSAAKLLACPAYPLESPRGAEDPALVGAGGAFERADLLIILAPWDFTVPMEEVKRPRRLGVIHVWPNNPPARPAAGVLHLRAKPLDALRIVLAAEAGRDSEWNSRVEAERRAAREAVAREASASHGDGVHPLRVAEAVRARLRPEDVVAMDGGEFGQWVRLGLAQGAWRTLVNGKFGPVGTAFPNGLGVRAAFGDGPAIVVLAGDGGFGYHAMEIETAVRERLPVVVIVGTDGKWAAEWHLQRKRYGPDRLIATELLRCRYEQVAEGLGGFGVLVREEADLTPALDAAWRAMRDGRTAVVNVMVAPLPSPVALH